MRLKYHMTLESSPGLDCDYTVTKRDKKRFVAVFETTAGDKVEFTSTMGAPDEPDETWDASYKIVKGAPGQASAKIENAIEIHSTLICIMKEFISSMKPKAFVFSSKGRESKIYNRLIYRLNRDINNRGYSYTSYMSSGETHHIFKKGRY